MTFNALPYDRLFRHPKENPTLSYEDGKPLLKIESVNMGVNDREKATSSKRLAAYDSRGRQYLGLTGSWIIEGMYNGDGYTVLETNSGGLPTVVSVQKIGPDVFESNPGRWQDFVRKTLFNYGELTKEEMENAEVRVPAARGKDYKERRLVLEYDNFGRVVSSRWAEVFLFGGREFLDVVDQERYYFDSKGRLAYKTDEITYKKKAGFFQFDIYRYVENNLLKARSDHKGNLELSFCFSYLGNFTDLDKPLDLSTIGLRLYDLDGDCSTLGSAFMSVSPRFTGIPQLNIKKKENSNPPVDQVIIDSLPLTTKQSEIPTCIKHKSTIDRDSWQRSFGKTYYTLVSLQEPDN